MSTTLQMGTLASEMPSDQEVPSWSSRVRETLRLQAEVKAACPSFSGAIRVHDSGEGYSADCPSCAGSGYDDNVVCDDCFGAGDQYAETVADLVDLMSMLTF